VTAADLRAGAKHQLRGHLSLAEFDRCVVPHRGLDSVVVAAPLKESLQAIVQSSKAQAILFGQWGFTKQHGTARGTSALFYGAPGTGKTLAAEAIGYDLGRPLKVVNCAQLISKWVGESAKNIDAVFKDARASDAIMVFDEAESLFGRRDQTGSGGAGNHDRQNVGVLLHLIETVPGVPIVITTHKQMVDPAFFRRFKHVLEFKMPTRAERRALWELLLPDEAPKGGKGKKKGVIDYASLARHALSGGAIKSAVFRAATKAAIRRDEATRVITQADLEASAQEELEKNEAADAAPSEMFM